MKVSTSGQLELGLKGIIRKNKNDIQQKLKTIETFFSPDVTGN